MSESAPTVDAVATAAAVAAATTTPAAAAAVSSSATSTIPLGTVIQLDRSNNAHGQLLCESYIFNVGVGNSRRHDLFPGNKAFWEWIHQRGYFLSWMESNALAGSDSKAKILQQVKADWEALGGRFYRYSHKAAAAAAGGAKKPAAGPNGQPMAATGETLSPMEDETILAELRKRFITTKSNMSQPRKKKDKSVWCKRIHASGPGAAPAAAGGGSPFAKWPPVQSHTPANSPWGVPPPPPAAGGIPYYATAAHPFAYQPPPPESGGLAMLAANAGAADTATPDGLPYSITTEFGMGSLGAGREVSPSESEGVKEDVTESV